MKDNYHHGDLRNALIEAGLKIINVSGKDSLSLRKVASACGVSHAAPYAHFSDKESLMEAIKQMDSLRNLMMRYTALRLNLLKMRYLPWEKDISFSSENILIIFIFCFRERIFRYIQI